MGVLYTVLSLALLLSVGAAAAFIWADRTGRMDLKTSALRILHHDGTPDATDAAAPEPPAKGRKRRRRFTTTRPETPLARSTMASIGGGETTNPKTKGT
jgi:nitrogen fixation-related uncharacterized protein